MLTYVNRFGRTIIATDVVISATLKVWVGWFSFFPFVIGVVPTHTYFGVNNGYR